MNFPRLRLPACSTDELSLRGLRRSGSPNTQQILYKHHLGKALET